MQVLNAAYIIVAMMCTFLGFTGYFMYGSGVLDVITFNLPKASPRFLPSCSSEAV